MSKLVDTKHTATATCSRCHGLGSYVTDDFNQAEGVALIVQVCTRCLNEAGLPLVQLPNAAPVVTVDTTPVAPAARRSVPTPRQISFIGNLIAELEELGDTEIHALVAARISGYDFELASKCITKLQLRKAQRVADKAAAAPTQERASAQVSYQDVPAGHYATASRTGNNDLDFWAVSVGKDGGRWAGYRFVERVIGGHENTPVRGAESRKALEAIVAAGVYEAGALYGQTIGKCGRCNRHLTDETSREQGYGPECITKVAA